MTDKYQDLIDDYLRAKLSEEQRREVERLADTDEGFRAELDFHKQTKSAFAQQQHEQLKQRLQSLSDDTVRPLHATRPKKTKTMSLWLVASTILLICAVSVYLWSLKQQKANPPDFFSHHCTFVADPIKWLNKFEKLISDNEVLFSKSSNRGRMIKCYTIIESKRKEIEQTGYKHTVAKLPMQYVNAECEERYFSFKETKNKVDDMQDYTEKIMFLTKEKFDYEQASIDFINPKLPDYSVQCQKEIDQIQHLNRLTNELSIEQMLHHQALKPDVRLFDPISIYLKCCFDV